MPQSPTSRHHAAGTSDLGPAVMGEIRVVTAVSALAEQTMDADPRATFDLAQCKRRQSGRSPDLGIRSGR